MIGAATGRRGLGAGDAPGGRGHERDDTTNAELTLLLDGLVAAIAGSITPGEGLRDVHAGAATPADHYGQLAAALALAGDEASWASGRVALDTWLAADAARIGHLPFNRLLLHLLEHTLQTRGAGDDLRVLRAAIDRCPLASRYPSNNWALLAQCCRLIEAPPPHRARETARFCRLLERWTTPAGGFIDFPAPPRGRFATPIAYHHKALFLTALACRFDDDPALVRHAGRLLDWLVLCWDPAGYAGGLGRSNHAAFGDGCLLAALVLLGFDTPAPQGPVATLARRLALQRRPDGWLWPTPSGPATADASWDDYMHLSVYHAWTAAVVVAARTLCRTRPAAATASPEWRAGRDGCFEDPQAGLVCLRLPAGTALIATRGQPPQSFSRDEADFRYAGGLLLQLRDARGRACIPPPVRCSRARLLADPALAGWTPLFRVGDVLFALTDFDDVEREGRADGWAVTLRGHPVALTRPAARGAAANLLAALDWRMLDGRLGRHASLRRARCNVIEARLELLLSASLARVAVTLELRVGRSEDIEYLNPGGHALIGPVTSALPWREAELPSSLPGAIGRCLAPQRLGPGRHLWTLDAAFGSPHHVSLARHGADEPAAA